MLAGVLWGATTLAMRATALGQASAEKTLLYQLAVSAVLLLGAALLSGAPVPVPVRLSTLAWAALLFQVVIVTFVSYLVWFWLIRHYPATRLSSFTMLTPMFGLAARRAAAGRADHRAADGRPGDGRRRHLPGQPEHGVTKPLLEILLRGGACAALAWGLRHLGLPLVVLLGIGALAGILLARPLIDLAIEIYQAMRRANWREVEGRHYAFKGRTVHVVQDADYQRWVRLADIRAIAGFTASDAALQVTYPTGWRRLGRPPLPHLSDEALLAHIAKERSPEAMRLRLWVEREIVFPARRERERHGIRLDRLDFRISD